MNDARLVVAGSLALLAGCSTFQRPGRELTRGAVDELQATASGDELGPVAREVGSGVARGTLGALLAKESRATLRALLADVVPAFVEPLLESLLARREDAAALAREAGAAAGDAAARGALDGLLQAEPEALQRDALLAFAREIGSAISGGVVQGVRSEQRGGPLVLAVTLGLLLGWVSAAIAVHLRRRRA